MSELDDLYFAVEKLDQAVTRLERNVHGSRSPDYDFCHDAKIYIKRARTAYEKLAGLNLRKP